MFRLHRSKGGTKSGEKIDFKFTNIQANQVPKGWDKLFVSIISVETGKTLAKSSKALVRNGSCLWRETLTESVWVARDHSSKDLENCSFRFVIAMGSSRSGILGEATVNLTRYIDTITPVPLSLTLKKCTHGTTLQVSLHCSAPRNRYREEGQDDVSSHSEDLNADFDAKSDGSQGSFARSFGSSSGKDPDSNSQPGGTPSRATSLSASDSRRSSISADGSTGRGAFSPRNLLNGDKYSSVTRHDSAGSPSIASKFVEDSYRSNYSPLSSKGTSAESGQIALLKNVGSSKSLLEAAENTIDEVRSEAKMWERNARKLMVDLDVLKKEFSDQSSSKANLELELSAARAETDGLKKEIRQLELSLEEMKIKQKVPEYSTSRSHIEKGLEDEIKFNRESNSELALQLKKAQESNIELVSILQELEEIIETQKVEIQELSDLSSKVSNTDISIHEGSEESKSVVSNMHILEESAKLLLEKVKHLEEDLKEKTFKLETERSLRNKLQQNELEYNRTLADKDVKILNLESKLASFLEMGCPDEPTAVGGGSTDLKTELEALKEKVQELERDCTELTDENLELLFKLKKFQNSSEKEGDLNEFLPREPLSKSFMSSGTEDGETEAHSREAEIDKRPHKMVEVELLEASKTFSEIFRQLQTTFALVNDPLQNFQKSDYERNDTVIDNQVDVEDGASYKEKADLILRHLTEFSKALEAYVSANKTLEKKMTELEIRKQDQELHISELERENVEISERISGLEAQLRYLTNEKESTCMELEKSQRLVSTLQDQLLSVGKDMEQKLLDQKEKMEDVQKRSLEHQEEIEYLNESNSKLQATAENVMEECDSLQKSNAKLRSQKFELHEQCTHLEAELREMKEKFTSCSKSVESLENNLSLMLENFSSKEKILTSELDALLDENGKHKEQVVLGESLLNQLYEDKTVEAERLQKEVKRLTQLMYSTHDEWEKMFSDAVQEVSRLSEDNAKLGSVLREAQSKTVQLESELNNAQTESSMKVQSLMVEIAALKQGNEIMKADYEKMTKLVERCKLNEDRLKASINNLELKLTVLEYERQQVLEESSGLKIQLEKIENLKDEIGNLKSILSTTKLEKDRLDSTLQLMRDECETLGAEKIILTEKVSSLEKTATAYEDCKRTKNSLEEKILRLEGDIIAKEATCAQDIELKNELGRVKSENRQLQRKIEKLEIENDQLLRKYQVLDEELKLLKEAKHVQNLKRDNVASTDQRRMSRKKASFKISQGQEHLQSERTANGDQFQGEADNTNKLNDDVGSDLLSRIQTLEIELADALEANHLYKLQLKRLSEGNNNTMTRSKSSMEVELRDIKERYLHMSLKYAEVEAQREELVMKLKAARSGKKWF